jgi:hypothetical protein
MQSQYARMRRQVRTKNRLDRVVSPLRILSLKSLLGLREEKNPHEAVPERSEGKL